MVLWVIRVNRQKDRRGLRVDRQIVRVDRQILRVDAWIGKISNTCTPDEYYKWEKSTTSDQPSTLHKKWSFALRISSVNVSKSAVSCGFGHIY